MICASCEQFSSTNGPVAGESHFDELSRQPVGGVGPALVASDAHGSSASLHLDDSGLLWLRIEEGDGILFDEVGHILTLAGRLGRRGPFVLAGSFAQYPAHVRRVRVEYGSGAVEAATSNEGWLCFVPPSVAGPVRVEWTNDDGTAYDAVDHPPLGEAGTFGPSPYGPRRPGSAE